MDLAFVHPTYAIFVVIPLVRLRARASCSPPAPTGVASAGGLVAFGAPGAARLRVARADRRGHAFAQPGCRRARARRAVRTRPISSSARRRATTSRPASPRGPGAIAVAALVLVPLAAFAARRRWSAFVLGGTVLVLALELWPLLFPHFSDLVSLSQSRRAAGFVPFAFALAGGAAVLSRALRLFVLPVALAAGIVLQLEYPGDFGRRLTHGGPALATWIALWGGARRRSPSQPCSAAAASRPLRAPGLAAGARRRCSSSCRSPCTASRTGTTGPQRDAYALTPGLVQFLRAHVPERDVVFADLETSYRISAYVPVYVAAGAADACRRHEGEPARQAGAPTCSDSCGRATSRSRVATARSWLVLRAAGARRARGAPRLP